MADTKFWRFQSPDGEFPVWTEALEPGDEGYGDHDICEADAPHEGPIHVASVEGDIAIHFCEAHAFENMTPVTKEEYNALYERMCNS
jgi:hypothetical protein